MRIEFSAFIKTNHIQLRRAIFLSILAVVLLANKCEKSAKAGAVHSDMCDNPIEITTHNLTGLDGCSWALALKDGTRLEPVNLRSFIPEPKEGQAYYVTLIPVKDAMSICMVGQLVEITCLEHVTN